MDKDSIHVCLHQLHLWQTHVLSEFASRIYVCKGKKITSKANGGMVKMHNIYPCFTLKWWASYEQESR